MHFLPLVWKQCLTSAVREEQGRGPEFASGCVTKAWRAARTPSFPSLFNGSIHTFAASPLQTLSKAPQQQSTPDFLLIGIRQRHIHAHLTSNVSLVYLGMSKLGSEILYLWKVLDYWYTVMLRASCIIHFKPVQTRNSARIEFLHHML